CPAPLSTLFPYTTLFRSLVHDASHTAIVHRFCTVRAVVHRLGVGCDRVRRASLELGVYVVAEVPEIQVQTQPIATDRIQQPENRSEEHTSELQSRSDLVC